MGRGDSWKRELKRGEVWFVNFDPLVGGEIQKQRPAVIVSNDASNQFLNRAQVVPVSSQIEKLYPSEALISLNGEARKAMAIQLTAVNKLLLRIELAVYRLKIWKRSSKLSGCNSVWIESQAQTRKSPRNSRASSFFVELALV